ncbi:BTB/POZ domain-containing protein At5g03250-like [Rhododendron vialii]|uniref:BTB/POZ domain-containing protein At5g03250-like n=1 Tax=Rhododendron vialii TaxID=182163 RepID=UPI00265EEAEF|nr:BTB/POZ domain-containing protein At5g03250-like [Rhododendron vialii]
MPIQFYVFERSKEPLQDMAFMRLGSKSEAFHREGQTWQCTSGLQSDVTVEIGDMAFHLHKFPLMSRSGLLEKRIGELSSGDGSVCVLQLHDIPGGAKSFELIAKFCYGVKMELTALNVVVLRCAAEYLEMDEHFGEGNLIAQTEGFLNEVFSNWADTIKALKTCEEVLPFAEEHHIVSRCINSLAMKTFSDTNLLNWPVSGSINTPSPRNTILWNGISTKTKTQNAGDDWWYEDVSSLSLPLYKRLILAVELGGMKPEKIAGSLIFFAKRHLPLMNKDTNHANPGSTISVPPEADQRTILEEIVELLPIQKGVTNTQFLLRLLHAAMILHASPSCRESLEKRVGAQLDQASLEDVLIPNMGYSVETLYDIDCFQRILDHFMLMDQAAAASSPCIVEEGQSMEGDPHSLTSITMVANLVDVYLADVAPDVNLKFPKFQLLAAAVPDYARPLADSMYRAIDIYLKAHPWLTDSEREQICRLMNCQKLSIEASTHAAQNERLPLRVIVQVLFFEQLRLRTSISGWFFVSDNLESSQNPNGNLALSSQDRAVGIDDIRERLSDLEKECQMMRREIQKLVKTKRSWNIFCRRKSPHSNTTLPIPSSLKPPAK